MTDAPPPPVDRRCERCGHRLHRYRDLRFCDECEAECEPALNEPSDPDNGR